MDKIDDFSLKSTGARNYVIPLLIVVSIVLGARIIGAPDSIQTVYTQEEIAILEQAEELAKKYPALSDKTLMESYPSNLASSLDLNCEDNLSTFVSQSDLMAYLDFQYQNMKNINGMGSCITFSGFPLNQVDVANSLVAELEKSVVLIKAGTSTGTGFVLSDNTLFTNFHVIANDQDKPETSITIETLNGETYKATLLDGVMNKDLAILQTERDMTNVSAVEFSKEPLLFGQPVISIGHPSSMGNWRATLGIYYGDMSNIFGVQGPRFSLPGISGASGSPVFNTDGKLVAAIYGLNDTHENLAKIKPEARYSTPLHSPILSSYSVAAGISTDNILELMTKINP